MLLNVTNTKNMPKAPMCRRIHLGRSVEVTGTGMTITPRDEVVAPYDVT